MKNKIIFLSCVTVIALTGCTKDNLSCGDSSVKESLTRGTIENYPESIRNFLEVSIPIIEENKDDKGNFIKSCTATAEVKFKSDLAEKFNNLKESLSKYKSYNLSNASIQMADKTEISYQIKKNEADGGHYISGKYMSKSGFGISERVPQWVNDSENVIKTVKQIHQLRALNELLEQDARTGAEFKKLVYDYDLEFEFCEEKYTGRSFDLICRVSNPAGFIDVVSSTKLNEASIEMMKFIEAMAVFGGQSIKPTNKKITDPVKIGEYMNDKISFTTQSEPNEAPACKLAPSLCQ